MEARVGLIIEGFEDELKTSKPLLLKRLDILEVIELVKVVILGFETLFSKVKAIHADLLRPLLLKVDKVFIY